MKFQDWWISSMRDGKLGDGKEAILPAMAARLAWDAALAGSPLQITLNRLERDKAGKGYPLEMERGRDV